MREEIRNKPSVSPGEASTPYSGSSNLDNVQVKEGLKERGNNNQQDKKDRNKQWKLLNGKQSVSSIAEKSKLIARKKKKFSWVSQAIEKRREEGKRRGAENKDWT